MIDTVPSLVDALRQHRLLEPEQLDELMRKLQPRFTEPRALARELVKRGWITPYQINQVSHGRGADLVLGAHVLLERLGEGGMGQVFKARQRKLDRIVAIKVIRKERLDNPSAVRRFQREIRAVSQLSHPNIVTALDADEVDGVSFLAMEYIEGIDLSRLVKESGALPVVQACDYIQQTALGLQHAFERGMVHRDIKPSNLVLTRPAGRNGSSSKSGTLSTQKPVVKILDMGLARLENPSSMGELSATLTQDQAVLGTPDYIAPEQARNPHEADVRADLYSLGCTFYYLLSGQVPFPGVTPMEKVIKHSLEEPDSIEKLRPDVPPQVVAVIKKLMAKRPEDRYQTPKEVALAIGAAMQSVPLVTGPQHHANQESLITTVPAVRIQRTGLEMPQTDVIDATTAWTSPLSAKPRRRRLLFGAIAGVVFLGLVGVLVAALVVRGLDRPSLKTAKPTPSDHGAEAAYKLLSTRADDPRAEKEQLRADLLTFRTRYPGTPQSLHAAELIASLPSPLDKLTPLPPGPIPQPKNVVAVLGDQRLRHLGIAKACAFSPDNKWLASVDERGVYIWDANTGQAVAFWHMPGQLTSVAFGPDGQLAVGSNVPVQGAPPDGVIRLWSMAKSPAIWKEQTALKGHANGVVSMVWAGEQKDRKLVVRCGDRKVFKVWDVTKGTEKEIRLESPAIQTFAVSPAGHTLALGDGDKGGLIRLWDIDKGAERGQLSGHTQPVISLSYTADGKTLVSASGDGTLKKWDTATDKEQQSIKVKEPIRIAALAPGGETIALAFSGQKDQATRLWDMTANAEKARSGPLHTTSKESSIGNLAYSPDGKSLAGMINDATLRFATLHVWDAATGAERFPTHDNLQSLGVAAMTPDGETIVTVSADRRLRVYDITSKRVRAEQQLIFPNWLPRIFQENRMCAVFGMSPDGSTMVVPAQEAGLTVRKVIDLKEVVSLKKDGVEVLAVAYAPDGKTLAAALGPPVQLRPVADKPVPAKMSADKSIVIWELPSGKELSTIPVQTQSMTALTFSPDGKSLTAICADSKEKGKIMPLEGSIKFWDIASGQLQSDSSPSGPVAGSLAYSPDGKTLASATMDKSIKLVEVATGKERSSLQGHTTIPFGLTYSIDGKRLYSMETNGNASRILAWDLSANAKPAEWHIPGALRSMAVASDGRHIAVFHQNGTVFILRTAPLPKSGG